MANQGNNLHICLCFLLIFTAKCVAAASDGNQDQLVVSDAQQQQPLLDSFHDEAALRATAERSLLKGKKSYGTDFGDDQQQLDAGGNLDRQPLDGDSGLAQREPAVEREKEAAEQRGLDKGRPVYYSEKSPPSAVALPDPSTAPLDNAAERPISDSATESGNEQTKLNGTDQPESQGNRVYQLLRTNFCVHVCMHTLPPWYSELSAPNCNTTTENECLKAPETRDDCKQRCPLIVKQLPRRPFFHCPAYCEIAYAGQQHTLKFCKSKCSEH